LLITLKNTSSKLAREVQKELKQLRRINIELIELRALPKL
jgi:hypothetical protein